MATVPPRPPARGPGPARQPGRPVPPGRSPALRPGAPRPAGPGARAAPRKAERIRYSAAKVEETPWGRWVLGLTVALGLVLGAVGWYRYITRPRAPVQVAASAARGAPGPAAPAALPARAPAAPGASPASAAAAPLAAPVSLSPQSLTDELRSDPSLTPAQAFAQRFKNREVTWSGTVTTVWPTADKLLHFEFKESGGARVVVWCPSDAELAAGAAVTVRGHLASKLNDGFEVDRCQIL
jgi:hypothetical protein